MREGEVTPLRGVWEVKEHAAARRERSADTRRRDCAESLAVGRLQRNEWKAGCDAR
jgi:hypothetical protein